jgi:hypothetical protein
MRERAITYGSAGMQDGWWQACRVCVRHALGCVLTRGLLAAPALGEQDCGRQARGRVDVAKAVRRWRPDGGEPGAAAQGGRQGESTHQPGVASCYTTCWQRGGRLQRQPTACRARKERKLWEGELPAHSERAACAQGPHKDSLSSCAVRLCLVAWYCVASQPNGQAGCERIKV